MVSVKLYVEGGGDSETLHSRCREGFSDFIGKAGFKGRMPRIVACGGRRAAYDRFNIACKSGEKALLLIDSEDFVAVDSPWEHLFNRPGDRFAAPQNATDNHCHLIVVCMEAWFLSDRDALSKFFGQGFNVNALPKNSNIEVISKNDVYTGLQRATSQCKTKAPYGKGEHSFIILSLISPDKVCIASPWAMRFFEKLDAFMKT